MAWHGYILASSGESALASEQVARPYWIISGLVCNRKPLTVSRASRDDSSAGRHTTKQLFNKNDVTNKTDTCTGIYMITWYWGSEIIQKFMDVHILLQDYINFNSLNSRKGCLISENNTCVTMGLLVACSWAHVFYKSMFWGLTERKRRLNLHVWSLGFVNYYYWLLWNLQGKVTNAWPRSLPFFISRTSSGPSERRPSQTVLKTLCRSPRVVAEARFLMYSVWNRIK